MGNIAGILVMVVLVVGLGIMTDWLQFVLTYILPLLTVVGMWLLMQRAARRVPELQGAFRNMPLRVVRLG